MSNTGPKRRLTDATESAIRVEMSVSPAIRTLPSSVWAAAAVPPSVLTAARKLKLFVDPASFTGTDRGLLRSVLGPWSPVPKCEAPGAPISVEEHTSMAPRPRRQSQNPPLQKSSAIPA